MKLSKEQQYVVFGLTLFVVSGAVALVWQKWNEGEGTHIVEVQRDQEVTEKVAEGVLVQVSGAVQFPGVYRLAPGARVMDAIQLAGGAQSDADVSHVNLVSLLEDGVQLKIPFQQNEFTVGSSPGGSSGDKISLNRATAIEFQKLPGIGKSISEKIVSHRETNGYFSSIEDVKKVPGVGKKMFERLKDKLQL